MTFVAKFKIKKQNPLKATFRINFNTTKVSQLENDLHFQTESEVASTVQTAINEVTIETDTKIAEVNETISELSNTVEANYSELNTKITDNHQEIIDHLSDKANPHEVTKTQVGLGNVDNTSDLNKPISTATQNALNGKVDKTTSNSKLYGTNNNGEQTTLAYGSTLTANYIVQRDANSQILVPDTPTANGHSTSKKYVDDTAETKVDKVSTAKRVYGTDANGAQTTYDYDSFGKVDDVKVGNTSVVTNKIANLGTMAGENANDYSTTLKANSLYAEKALETTVSNHISDKANPHEVTKTQVGLGNVDNTSDINKPISTATQTALDGKVPTSRTVNDKALSANITLDYSDVNALSNATTINDLTTSAQQNALNSGITDTLTEQITTNKNDISSLSNTVTNNYNSLDGRITTNTNNIATINGKIPSQASSSNQLADKDFVNSSIATNTANFIGTFNSIVDLNNYSGTVTNNDYALVINSVITDNGNDWATFAALDAYNKSLLTNFDYAWVINGTNFDLYRFDIVNQDWELRASNTPKESVALNTAYNRYKATVSGSTVTWNYEYTLNNSSFTAAQWAAINSGITDVLTGQITINQGDISTINGTLATFGNIVTHNTSEFATAAQGTLADTALQPNDNISELNNDVGYITGINSTDVVNALGYTPYNSSNPSGYITGINSTDVVNALGYTPYNSSNPDGYQANIIEAIKVNNVSQTITSKTVNIIVPTDTSDLTNGAGFITGINSTDVVNALGYTPYDATNPDGYTTNIGTVTSVNNAQPDANGNVSITIPDVTNLANKDLSNLSATGETKFQAPLVSGTNIKTVNNTSLLGNGNITIDSLPSQTGNSGKFLTTDGTNASWAETTKVTIRDWSVT